MRRMRSKLNNLVHPTDSGVTSPPVAVQGVGLNRQTSAIQNQLQAAGIYAHNMMPEMYGPGGYAQPHEQQLYPHMNPGMQQGAMHQGMMPQMPPAPNMQMQQQAQMSQQAPMQQMAQQAQPNMYPAAQQMPTMQSVGQPAPAPEMDHIRTGLERLSANIQQLAAANSSGGQDAAQVQKQNELITAELIELRKQVAMTSEHVNSQDLAAQLEAIRQAVEAALVKSANPEAFASAVEASHNKISDELYEFKNALSNNNMNPEMFAHTFEARHDEISRSINDLQHSINAAIGNPGLYAQTVENSHRELSQQFEDFKHTMLEQAAVNQQVESPDFSPLEMRLEEITRAIVALSAGSQNQDGLERIEARISDLAKTVSVPQIAPEPVHIPNYDDHFNQVHHNLQVLESRLGELQTGEQNDTNALDAQIQQISDKMDVLSASNAQVNEVSIPGVEGLEQHITLLSEKLDNFATIANDSSENHSGEALTGGDNTALISRLDELVGEVVHLRADNSNDQAMATRMNDLVGQLETLNANQPSGDAHTDQIIAHLKELSQSVDNLSQRDASTIQNVDLSSLETQLNHISQQLDVAPQHVSAEGLPVDEISQRLTGIEQQIGASRDIAIELASQAATDAVQRTMEEIPSGVASGEGVDSVALQVISQNIQNLNEQSVSAHAQYIEQFDAVKNSITQLAERNDKLESELVNRDAAIASIADKNYQEQPVTIEVEAHEEEQNKQSHQGHDETAYGEILEHAHAKDQIEDAGMQIDTMAEQTQVDAQFSNAEQQNEYVPAEAQQNEYASQEPYEQLPQDEFLDARQSDQGETSTADLINKIRENARAEQNLVEETASEQAAVNSPELVLAEAAGIKFESAAIDVNAQANMAQQIEEPTYSSEPSPVYSDMDAMQTQQASADSMAYGMPEQAMPHLQQDASHGALPHVDVPSLDVDHEDDDLPLEPGSAGPDLAELVRQVNERRMDNTQNNLSGSGSDFLASARRAAQAAAQEASMVEEEIEQTEKKGLLASLPGLLARKKKILMIGVVAVAIFAIAIPFITSSDKSTSEELASEKTVVIENTATADASGSLFSDEPVIEEGKSSIENEVQEVSIDDSVDTSIVAPAIASETQDQTAAIQSNASEQATISEAAEPVSQTTAASLYDVSELNFVTPELRKAAEGGSLTAMFEVGRQYTNGETTKKDLVKASTWYQRAANHDHAPAQYMVGNFNEKGFGMEPNIKNAVTWYEKAADQGNVIAMHNLGVLYASPGRVNEKPDLEKAFTWFKKAADYGVRDSQVNMGIFYTKGYGTEVNLAEAYKWFSIASKDGDGDAKKKLLIIEESLRPEQKQAAKESVANWKPIKADPAANEVNTPDSWKVKTASKPTIKIDRKTIQQTQAVLNKLGYTAGKPDGLMGNQTRSAISKYQQTEGLQVTGTINPELVKSLIAKMSG